MLDHAHFVSQTDIGQHCIRLTIEIENMYDPFSMTKSGL